jgi:hypothetical protein
MASLFWAINRTGGTTGDLDGIDEDNMLDGDIAIVIDESNTTVYIYTCNSSIGGVQVNPTLIKPNGATSNKRWVLVDMHGEDILISGSGTMKAGTAGTTITEFSTDGTMAGNSDDAVPTEKAVKTYVDTTSSGILRADHLVGFVQRPIFTYTDLDTFHISGGGVYHINSKDKLYYTASDITFDMGSGGSNAASDDISAGAAGWQYIYIDESSLPSDRILIANDFLNCLTAPTYSDTKRGWYGTGVGNATTSDRCIFAVYDEGGDTGMPEPWYHIGTELVMMDGFPAIVYSANVDETWRNVNAYAPVIALEVIAVLIGNYQDQSGMVIVRKDGTDGIGTTISYAHSQSDRHSWGTFRTVVDNAGQFEIRGPTVANSNTGSIYQKGWTLGKGV